MKNITFFSILIYVSFILGTVSCEKTDIQKPLNNDNSKIGFRNVPDDCSDCPVNDCCCAVVWTSGQSPTTLNFCGTDDPDLSANECKVGDVGACNDIMGYAINRTVSSSDPHKPFACNKIQFLA